VSGLKLTQNPVTCTAVRIRVVSLTTIHESPQLILQRSELHDAFLSHRIVCVSGWKYSWEAQATTIDIQRWCRRHWDRWWVRAASRVHAAEVPVRPRIIRLLPQILFHSEIKTPAFDCRELLAAKLFQITPLATHTHCVFRSSHALGTFEHRPFGVQDAVEVKVTWVNHVLFLCVGVIVFGLFLAIPRVLPGYPSGVSELDVPCEQVVLLDRVLEHFSLAESFEIVAQLGLDLVVCHLGECLAMGWDLCIDCRVTAVQRYRSRYG
jgi:hypothetical protein